MWNKRISDPINECTLFSNTGIKATYAYFHFWINDAMISIALKNKIQYA